MTDRKIIRRLRWLLRRPWLAALLIVAAQQALLVGSRDLWWADEVRHADVLRHMIENGDWLALRLNDGFYPDKPPVYFWLLAPLAWLRGTVDAPLIMSAHALTVAAALLALLALARAVGAGRGAGLAAAVIFSTGTYVLVLSHYARMDFLFAALIGLSWACLFVGARARAVSPAMICGFLLAALATLTKGPFGAALPLAALVSFLILGRNLKRLAAVDVGLGLALALGLVGLWVYGIGLAGGPAYVEAIFSGQIGERVANGRDGVLGMLRYVATLPLVFLPWSLVFLMPAGTNASRGAAPAADGFRYAWSAALSGFVIVSLVGEKHEYYLLPLLLPLSILAADRLLRLAPASRGRFWAGVALFFVLIAGVLVVAPAVVPYRLWLPGLVLCAALSAATALALFRARRRAAVVMLAVVLAGQTLWINAVGLAVMPSLNAVFSPQPVVAALRPYLQGGHRLAAYGLVRGVLGHDLKATYAEFRDRDALRAWIEAQEKPLVVMPRPRWRRDFADDATLEIVAEVPLAGAVLVIAAAGVER
ncbi:hypothetical protein [Nitratireductor sp. StC3]|uniref:ArnT family glycosyltransferase n=1 Tax=Nitratireductor sp. StC3 TaxID=2126741 RepID=UPI000D0DFC5C|nr:hypothetical protein [Nitratireductor sp. StC3]PSM16595.1 hypothetical protein C7T96_19970 [Nitratireductor sp. StC3]